MSHFPFVSFVWIPKRLKIKILYNFWTHLNCNYYIPKFKKYYKHSPMMDKYSLKAVIDQSEP